MKRISMVLMVLVLLLAMTGVAQAGTATVKVGVNGSHFGPATKSVPTGTKVIWKGISGSHTVTAYSKNWSKNASVGSGGSTAFTFKKAGVYKYRCTIHSTLSGSTCSGMCGKIVVG
jgi:plastocyanin